MFKIYHNQNEKSKAYWGFPQQKQKIINHIEKNKEKMTGKKVKKKVIKFLKKSVLNEKVNMLKI